MGELELSDGLSLWLAIAVVPLLLTACTSFTKVSVVLSALRVGLGAERILPWGSVFALAVVMTGVIMAPIGLATAASIEASGGLGHLAGGLSTWESWSAWETALEPLVSFMTTHADVQELEFFAGLQGLDSGHPLVLIPAFLVTELASAFAMAVVILVPLVAVDVLLAQLYALIGLPGQSQLLVALPAKLLLFLAVDGWDVVLGGLVEDSHLLPVAGLIARHPEVLDGVRREGAASHRGGEQDGADRELDRGRKKREEFVEHRPLGDDRCAEITGEDVPEIDQVLDDQGAIEAVDRLELLVALGAHAALAGEQQDRIARQEPDEGEGDDRDTDEGRHQ